MRPVGGWLADKLGAGLITSISIGTMAVGGFTLSAFLQPDEFTGFFPAVLIICGAAGLGNGSVFKIIPLVIPKEAGAAIGIVSSVRALGGFVPPLLLGWTMDYLGSPAWAYTGWLCLPCCVWRERLVLSPPHLTHSLLRSQGEIVAHAI